MTRKSRKPSLDSPPTKEPALKRALDGISEQLKRWRGDVGEVRERVVTFGDLEDGGIGQIGSGADGGGGNVIEPPPEKQYRVGPLTNLSTAPLFESVILSWDGTNQRHYAHTEIWRHTTDDLGTAVLRGTAIAETFYDQASPDQTYYYWVRAVSTSGNPGPFNATAGTVAQTDPSPDYIKNELTDTLQSTELASDLRDTLNSSFRQGNEPTVKSDGSSLVPGDRWVKTDSNGNTVDVYTYTGSYWVALDIATGAYVNTQITEQVGACKDNNGNVLTGYDNKTDCENAGYTWDNDEKLAQRIDTVSSTANSKNKVYRQSSAPSSPTAGDIWFDSDDSNRPYRWNGSSWVDVRDQKINTKVKTFRQNSQPTAQETGDLWVDSDDGDRLYRWDGNSWVDVQDQGISDNSASIQTNSQSINGLEAQYSVKIDNNGRVAGFGLSSEPTDTGGVKSNFIVRANRFGITVPASEWQPGQAYALDEYVRPTDANYDNGVQDGDGDNLVYLCTTAGTTGNSEPSWPTTAGSTVSDGGVLWTAKKESELTPFIVGQVDGSPSVVIGSAFIGDASIEDAKIKELAVNKISSGINDVGLEFTAATISGGKLDIGGSGGEFIVNEDGSLQIKNAKGNPQIEMSGSGDATFSGQLSAASGTFDGSLTAGAVNAVDTINLAGNSVTIPLVDSPFNTTVTDYSPTKDVSSFDENTNATEVASVTFDTNDLDSGRQIEIHFSAFRAGSFSDGLGSAGLRDEYRRKVKHSNSTPGGDVWYPARNYIRIEMLRNGSRTSWRWELHWGEDTKTVRSVWHDFVLPDYNYEIRALVGSTGGEDDERELSRITLMATLGLR